MKKTPIGRARKAGTTYLNSRVATAASCIIRKLRGLKRAYSWKMDPGKATIYAAIITLSVTAFPNMKKLWADDRAAKVEAEISIRDSNYAAINSLLDERRREVEAWEEALNADPRPEAAKQLERDAIKEYYESNWKGKLILEKNHVDYKQASRTDDPVRAAQSVNQIHTSQFAEASAYAGVKRGQKRPTRVSSRVVTLVMYHVPAIVMHVANSGADTKTERSSYEETVTLTNTATEYREGLPPR